MSSPPAGGRRNVNDNRSPLGNLPTVFPPQADCILIRKRKAKKKKKKNHAGIVAIPILKTGKLRSASLEPGDVKGKQGGGLGLEQRTGVLD